jgi:4-diphosphocytidyl-2-C-methyl-D-erythritol kinase
VNAIYDLAAPAKLNLFLHITGRRADGYHLLESLFVPIDWADTIHLEKRSDGVIERIDGPIERIDALGSELPADDLCTRAARALAAASGVQSGATILLEKRVPAQAGMGGGSSDAATVLIGLNRLWALNWPREQLMPIAAKLGADVPFFLGSGAAWVSGVGERIAPLKLPAAALETPVWVLKPKNGAETAAVFRHEAVKRDCEAATIVGFAADGSAYLEASAETTDWRSFGSNALQAAACAVCPDIEAALGALVAQGLTPRMTGSGSAVFAFDDRRQAIWSGDAPAGQLRLCRVLPEHPLAGF